MLKNAEISVYSRTRRCLAFLVSAFLSISSAFSTTLPSGYTELEYIDLDTQYIDTGLYLYTDQSTNHYPNIHFTFIPLRYRTDSSMTNYLGGRDSSLGGGNGILLGSVKPSAGDFSYIDYFDGTTYSTSGTANTGVQLNTKYEYSVINRVATLKDITNNTTLLSHTFGTSTQSSDNSLAINGQNRTGTVSYSNNKVRIYDFEVEGESNLMPAKRNSDNAVGLYDTVRNIFLLPNTGTATAGPEVLPCGYTRLEYIESTGTQTIDTGFVYNNNTRVIWDVQMTTTLPVSVSNNSGVGFVNTDYERLGFVYGASNQKITFLKANIAGSTGLSTIDVDNNRHVLEINSYINKAYVDGVEYTFDSSVSDINNDHNLTLPLFAWLGANGYQQYFSGKAYSVKIYDNGTLERNLIPAKRNSDYVIGMYDKVNNVFYTNNAGGTFLAGPEISSNDNCQVISINWSDLSEPDVSWACTYGETFTAPSVTPTPPNGYKFLGWKPL